MNLFLKLSHLLLIIMVRFRHSKLIFTHDHHLLGPIQPFNYTVIEYRGTYLIKLFWLFHRRDILIPGMFKLTISYLHLKLHFFRCILWLEWNSLVSIYFLLWEEAFILLRVILANSFSSFVWIIFINFDIWIVIKW